MVLSYTHLHWPTDPEGAGEWKCCCLPHMGPGSKTWPGQAEEEEPARHQMIPKE